MMKYSKVVWMKILKENQLLLTMIFTAALVSVGLNLLPAIITQWFVDDVLKSESMSMLLMAFLMIALAYVAKEIVRAGIEFSYQKNINKTGTHIRSLLVETVFRRNLVFHQSNNNKTFNVLINDINHLWNSGAQQLPNIALSLLIGVGASIYLIFINFWFFLFSFVVTFVTLIPIRKINKKQNVLVEEAHSIELSQTNFVKDFFDKPLFIKTNYKLKYYYKSFQNIADRLLKANLKRELNFRIFLVTRQVSDAIIPTTIYAFGGWLYFNGEITLGEIISSVMLINYITEPITQSSQYYMNLKDILPRLRRVNEELDKYQINKSNGETLLLKDDFEIKFNNVSFLNNELTIVENITFSIKNNERIIIKGKSGSGKTTLFNLMLRLIDPSEGNLLINGNSYLNYSPDSLKEYISMVPQESDFFTGTIKENFKIVNSDLTDEEIRFALYISASEEFIDNLPDGLDTLLSGNANVLSGGQRQRLAIARTLLKKPKVLLLDESISALDPQTANLILQRLKEIKGLTILLISHRIDIDYEFDREIRLDKTLSEKEVVYSGY